MIVVVENGGRWFLPKGRKDNGESLDENGSSTPSTSLPPEQDYLIPKRYKQYQTLITPKPTVRLSDRNPLSPPLYSGSLAPNAPGQNGKADDQPTHGEQRCSRINTVDGHTG